MIDTLVGSQSRSLNLPLTSGNEGVKYRHVGFLCVWLRVWGSEIDMHTKTILAALERKVLIDLDSPSCVVHLEHQDSQYSNLLTLTYVILLAYQQTILSPGRRQAGQHWLPLTTSLLLHLDFICVIVKERWRSLGGWIFQSWGKLPKTGSDLEHRNFTF